MKFDDRFPYTGTKNSYNVYVEEVGRKGYKEGIIYSTK